MIGTIYMRGMVLHEKVIHINQADNKKCVDSEPIS